MNKPLYLHTLVFCAIINIVDTFFFYCVLPYHLGIIRRCSLACIVLCLDITNTNHLNVEELCVLCSSTDSSKVPADGVYLPRENMSLPSHVQLNNMSSLCKGRCGAKALKSQHSSQADTQPSQATLLGNQAKILLCLHSQYICLSLT